MITNIDKKRYSEHKHSAKARVDKDGNRIEFNLTFEQWWDWWQATGHYQERGRKRGQYCMARYNDLGNYELGNIYCCTIADNNREMQKHKVITDEARALMSKSQTGRKHTPEAIEKMKAHVRTPEHCAKISENRKGIVFSDEHKRKIGEANEKRIISEETKEKIRQAMTGKKKTPEAIANNVASRKANRLNK